jgi:hypothetical protein
MSFIKSIWVSILVLLVVTWLACGPDTTHQFQISRHDTANFTNADADEMLDEATNLLQTNDGEGDVACNVALVRKGDVTEFLTGIGVINSPEDLYAVMGLPGEVKVVRHIFWCGVFSTFLGCSEIGGNSFIVTDLGPGNRSAVVWAHEFGHNKGLLDCHFNCQYKLMNRILHSANRRINSHECSAFLTPRTTIRQTGILTSVAQEPSGVAQLLDIKGFVCQTFIHGVPYEEAIRYGSDKVPILLEMLADTTEESYWSNIVLTMGMIGDEQTVEQIIAFIDKAIEGKLSTSQYTAKMTAIMALGYLINKSGSKKALTYLQDSLNPSVWTERKFKWTSSYHVNENDRNVQLSIMAIIGLGLSGHVEAGESLRSLQQPVATQEAKEFQAKVSDVINEALRAHEMIAKEGLIEYYRQAKY